MRFGGAHFGYFFLKAKSSRATHLFPALCRIQAHIIATCPGIKNRFGCHLNQEVLFYSLIVGIPVINETLCYFRLPFGSSRDCQPSARNSRLQGWHGQRLL